MNRSSQSIFKDGRLFLLAYDHGMEHGTADFDEQSIDPERILTIADSGYFTGVVLQKGVAEKYYQNQDYQVPLLVKLNGKTSLVEEEPYSPQLCSVAEAKELGAAAVGYTVYVGSQHEKKMMQEFSRIEQKADKAGLPLVGWMYPRGEAVKGQEHSKEIVSYAARLGLEVGAEAVKLPYTGDPDSFSWAVKAAGRVKVTVQGGKKKDKKGFFRECREIMSVGAAGLIIGRNIWQADNPLEVAKRLNEIIFNSEIGK